MIICKMIGIKKLTHHDVHAGISVYKDKVHEFTEEIKDSIKTVIDSLLFDDEMDSVLVNFNNRLVVCERTDVTMRQYGKKNLTYHPLSDDVKL